jgi:hypothetical protein
MQNARRSSGGGLGQAGFNEPVGFPAPESMGEKFRACSEPSAN